MTMKMTVTVIHLVLVGPLVVVEGLLSPSPSPSCIPYSYQPTKTKTVGFGYLSPTPSISRCLRSGSSSSSSLAFSARNFYTTTTPSRGNIEGYTSTIKTATTTTTSTTQLRLSPQDILPPFVTPILQNLHATPTTTSSSLLQVGTDGFWALFQLFSMAAIPLQLWNIDLQGGWNATWFSAMCALLFCEFHGVIVMGDSTVTPLGWLLVLVGATFGRKAAFVFARECILGIPGRLFQPAGPETKQNPIIRVIGGVSQGVFNSLFSTAVLHPLLAALQMAESSAVLDSTTTSWQSTILPWTSVAAAGLANVTHLIVSIQTTWTKLQVKDQAIAFYNDQDDKDDVDVQQETPFQALVAQAKAAQDGREFNNKYADTTTATKQQQQFFVQPTGGLFRLCQDPGTFATLVLYTAMSVAGLGSITTVTGWILWNLRLFLYVLLVQIKNNGGFANDEEIQKYGGQARFEEYRAKVKNRYPKFW